MRSVLYPTFFFLIALIAVFLTEPLAISLRAVPGESFVIRVDFVFYAVEFSPSKKHRSSRKIKNKIKNQRKNKSRRKRISPFALIRPAFFALRHLFSHARIREREFTVGLPAPPDTAAIFYGFVSAVFSFASGLSPAFPTGSAFSVFSADRALLRSDVRLETRVCHLFGAAGAFLGAFLREKRKRFSDRADTRQ